MSSVRFTPLVQSSDSDGADHMSGVGNVAQLGADSSRQTPSLMSGLTRAPRRSSIGLRVWSPQKMKKSSRRLPKAVLRLSDLEHAKSAVLNSLASPESRRSYEFAIQNFVQWYCSEPRLALNRSVVTRYRMQLEQLHLAPSDNGALPGFKAEDQRCRK
jgi:hypothetical protein